MDFYQIIGDWIRAEVGDAEYQGPLYKYSCCMAIWHTPNEPDILSVVFRSYAVCLLKPDICVSAVDSDLGPRYPADPEFFNQLRHMIMRSCDDLNFMLERRTVPAQIPTITHDGQLAQSATYGSGATLEHWCEATNVR